MVVLPAKEQFPLLRPSVGLSDLPILLDFYRIDLSSLTPLRGVYPCQLGVSTTLHDATSKEKVEDVNFRRGIATAWWRHESRGARTSGQIEKDGSAPNVQSTDRPCSYLRSTADAESFRGRSTASASNGTHHGDSCSLAPLRSGNSLAKAELSKDTTLNCATVPASPSQFDTDSRRLQPVKHGLLSTTQLENGEQALVGLSQPISLKFSSRTVRKDVPARPGKHTTQHGQGQRRTLDSETDQSQKCERNPNVSVDVDSVILDAAVIPDDLHFEVDGSEPDIPGYDETTLVVTSTLHRFPFRGVPIALGSDSTRPRYSKSVVLPRSGKPLANVRSFNDYPRSRDIEPAEPSNTDSHLVDHDSSLPDTLGTAVHAFEGLA